ncbi:MAG: Trk system potassium transporter TrkA [Candidatus Hydrogenedentes bacterium]|nr:Trk system potassium transporter TrkA [Candidatus Hydrogenedentota bacterium]
MNIFIAGGGRVGSHLARLLSSELQDVTVIEENLDQIEQIDYALDVSTAQGDGSSVLLLQSLNVGGAELFVASMGDDETNLIAAATAKGLGAKKVVARVDNPMYMESNILYETVLGVDYILSPDALAALEIANYIEHPDILSSLEFGGGRAQMRQVRAVKSPTKNGKTLKDVIRPRSGVLLGVINRDGTCMIPHGDSIVEPGDLVTLIGDKESLDNIQKMFHAQEVKPRRIAIMGGGTIGLRLAQALEGKMKTIKVFERHEARSQQLAAKLTKAKVVMRDATSRVALEQEHVDSMDMFVAATGDDERNIMAAVLAKEVGAKSVVAIVHQPDFAPLVKRLGIDLAVTPRASIADRILKMMYSGNVSSLAVLGDGQVEVLELKIGEGSSVLGKELCDIRMPRGALIGVILRGDKVLIPSGNDEIHAGDSVILIAEARALDAARKLLLKKKRKR